MKSIRNLSIIITVIMFLFFACESPSSNNEDQMVTLTGKVIDTENSTPIINAVIKVINISPEITEVTDSAGNFSVNFDLKEALNVQVIASKESYLPDTAVAMAVPGRTIELPLFQLSPTEDTPVISGGAASIVLAQQSTDH